MFTYAVSLSLALLASPAYAAVLNINVGLNGNTFTPSWIHAQPSDVINFIFHGTDHSVTQSTFDEPCISASSGFDSGFSQVASNYQLKVNNTDPLWVYCKQASSTPTHCQQGMVFAVNSPAYPPNTLAKFHANARDSTAQSKGSTPSTPSSPPPTQSASTGGVKAISDLSAVSSSDPSADSSNIQRLINYVPIMLGLLGGVILLVLGLLVLLILLVRKSGQQSKAGPKYKPIHLSRGKAEHEEEALEYQTPSGRYTDEH